MFCVLVDSYRVCMVVQSFWTTRAILPSPEHIESMNIMSIFHGIVCRRVASAAQHQLQNIRHMMCFLINVMLLCVLSHHFMHDM